MSEHPPQERPKCCRQVIDAVLRTFLVLIACLTTLATMGVATSDLFDAEPDEDSTPFRAEDR